MYRRALESIIYTCTEQLWSQESYVSVQNSPWVLYIPLQNSSGAWIPIYLYRIAVESGVLYTCTEHLWSPIYTCTEQLWSLESYIPVSPIYLYRTALESGVLYTCTEQLWSLLNSQSKFCRTWRKPLEQWILRLSYTNPWPNTVFQLSFHQFVHSLVYSYVWVVTCNLYNPRY